MATNQGATNPHFLWLAPLAAIFWSFVIFMIVKVVRGSSNRVRHIEEIDLDTTEGRDRLRYMDDDGVTVRARYSVPASHLHDPMGYAQQRMREGVQPTITYVDDPVAYAAANPNVPQRTYRPDPTPQPTTQPIQVVTDPADNPFGIK